MFSRVTVALVTCAPCTLCPYQIPHVLICPFPKYSAINPWCINETAVAAESQVSVLT